MTRAKVVTLHSNSEDFDILAGVTQGDNLKVRKALKAQEGPKWHGQCMAFQPPPTNQTPLLLCNSRICSPLWEWMLDPESSFAEATVLWSEDGGLVWGRPTETILKVKVCVWAEINWHWSHLYRHRPCHARWEGNLLLYYFIINRDGLNPGKIGKEKKRKSFILYSQILLHVTQKKLNLQCIEVMQ